MRQPVCVGCDGRELLTLNSVTAPLTEPHLNVHKRSPNTWGSFRGGRRVGASPGEQPRRGLHAEGRASQAQKPGQRHECRGVPPAGAVPAVPRHERPGSGHPEPPAMGSRAPNPMLCFTLGNRSRVHIQQQRHCRPGNGSMGWTSTRSAGDGVAVGCHGPLQGICCLLTIWGIASKPKKLSK